MQLFHGRGGGERIERRENQMKGKGGEREGEKRKWVGDRKRIV